MPPSIVLRFVLARCFQPAHKARTGPASILDDAARPSDGGNDFRLPQDLSCQPCKRHTEAIGKLGPLEKFLNTPSHHRVHHGVNPQYIDRNHGSILIIWDRLFGTFEPEGDRVVYGLTRNIKTFNPFR